MTDTGIVPLAALLKRPNATLDVTCFNENHQLIVNHLTNFKMVDTTQDMVLVTKASSVGSLYVTPATLFNKYAHASQNSSVTAAELATMAVNRPVLDFLQTQVTSGDIALLNLGVFTRAFGLSEAYLASVTPVFSQLLKQGGSLHKVLPNVYLNSRFYTAYGTKLSVPRTYVTASSLAVGVNADLTSKTDTISTECLGSNFIAPTEVAVVKQMPVRLITFDGTADNLFITNQDTAAHEPYLVKYPQINESINKQKHQYFNTSTAIGFNLKAE